MTSFELIIIALMVLFGLLIIGLLGLFTFLYYSGKFEGIQKFLRDRKRYEQIHLKYKKLLKETKA